MQPIDFTQCPRVVGKAYNGANGKKINYYDYLHDSHHPSVLSDMLTQLVPNIQALDVESLILSIPYLSALQQDFYINYLNRRRNILFN